MIATHGRCEVGAVSSERHYHRLAGHTELPVVFPDKTKKNYIKKYKKLIVPASCHLQSLATICKGKTKSTLLGGVKPGNFIASIWALFFPLTESNFASHLFIHNA